MQDRHRCEWSPFSQREVRVALLSSLPAAGMEQVQEHFYHDGRSDALQARDSQQPRDGVRYRAWSGHRSGVWTRGGGRWNNLLRMVNGGERARTSGRGKNKVHELTSVGRRETVPEYQTRTSVRVEDGPSFNVVEVTKREMVFVARCLEFGLYRLLWWRVYSHNGGGWVRVRTRSAPTRSPNSRIAKFPISDYQISSFPPMTKALASPPPVPLPSQLKPGLIIGQRRQVAGHVPTFAFFLKALLIES